MLVCEILEIIKYMKNMKNKFDRWLNKQCEKTGYDPDIQTVLCMEEAWNAAINTALRTIYNSSIHDDIENVKKLKIKH